MTVALLLSLLLQAAQPTASPAPPPAPPPLHGGPRDTVCPVGGDHFQAWQPTAYSTYGERPDGKPYSYLPFPLPLPECPSNHLVLFAAFTPAETVRLATLINSAAYRRLVTDGTSYYRAWWLASALHRPAADAPGLLLPAIWQVAPGDLAAPRDDGDARRARRYRALFVEEVGRLDPATPVADRLWLTARAANAARELGRFDEAEALRRRAVALLGQAAAKGWDRYLAALAPVIARRDPGVEPLDMVPDRQIASICAYRPPPGTFDRAVCARPDIAAQVAKLRP